MRRLLALVVVPLTLGVAPARAAGLTTLRGRRATTRRLPAET
jgi:hypothetical protein